MGDWLKSDLPASLRELFERECPYYMAMGMTYDEFWHGDVRMVIAFRKAHRIRKQMISAEQHMLGSYVYQAICSAHPLFAFKPHEPLPYMEEPYPVDSREVREREERKEREHYIAMRTRMKAFAESFNQRGNKDE